MSNAWETTADDVFVIMLRHKKDVSYKKAEELLDKLGCDEIEQAALSETDFDKQTDAAYAEITKQLAALGVL